MQCDRRRWQIFRTVLNSLRDSGLTRRRFRVRFVCKSRIDRETGIDAIGSYAGGVIHIADYLCERMAIEVLVHEYTHHLCLTKNHGRKFWMAYGRVFRSVYGDY